jgi:hypothetical protein
MVQRPACFHSSPARSVCWCSGATKDKLIAGTPLIVAILMSRILPRQRVFCPRDCGDDSDATGKRQITHTHQMAPAPHSKTTPIQHTVSTHRV